MTTPDGKRSRLSAPARVLIALAIGAILGGAFAPMISAWLVAQTGTATTVAFYIAGVMVVAFIATLHPDGQNQVEWGTGVFVARVLADAIFADGFDTAQ